MNSRLLKKAGILGGLLLPLCLPLAARQAASAAGVEECAVSGRVVNSATGQPLNRARVLLRGTDGREAPGTTTDHQGRFAVKNLQPGVYRLRVERNGFAAAEYGARSPKRPGADLTLAAGEEARDLEVALAPHGAITGRVIDPDGEPAPHTDIYCFEYARGAARRSLPLSATTTNDLGEFRIPELLPGRYVIAAVYRPKAAPAARESFVPTYYPGTADAAAAAPIEVAPGTEVRGIEIAPQRRPTAGIQGRVRYSAGRSGTGPTIMLLPRGGGGFLNARSARVREADGAFEIAGVTPGSYLLTAFLGEESRRHTAQVPVEVGPVPIEGIEITLAPGVDIAGRVRIEENAGIRLENLRLVLEPTGTAFNFVKATVRSDGAFVFEGVAPDTYTLKFSGMSEDAYVKRIRLGDEEMETTRFAVAGAGAGPLEVVLAAGSRLEGVVLDERDKPAGATVALAPEGRGRNRAHWCKAAETGPSGRFTLRGVAPGDYRLIASADADPDDFCAALDEFTNAGEKVSVQENAKQSAQVRMVGPKGN